jgi:hypothetical protein
MRAAVLDAPGPPHALAIRDTAVLRGCAGIELRASAVSRQRSRQAEATSVMSMTTLPKPWLDFM